MKNKLKFTVTAEALGKTSTIQMDGEDIGTAMTALEKAVREMGEWMDIPPEPILASLLMVFTCPIETEEES